MRTAMTNRPSTPNPSTDWEGIQRTLLGVAQGLTSNAAERDDLVQETLATLLAKAPEKALHRGYARSTLVRLWLDHQRSLRRRLARMARAAFLRPVHHTDAPAMDRDEQVRLVREAIEELPPRQRAAIVLRLVDGLPYEEIAESIGCDERAARSNLHLARARLRRILGVVP